MKVVDNNKYPVSEIFVALTTRSSGVLSGLFFVFDQTYTFPKTATRKWMVPRQDGFPFEALCLYSDAQTCCSF